MPDLVAGQLMQAQHELEDTQESESVHEIGSLSSPVGLIAGNGTFPIEFAEQARERGLEVVAVAHSGETDPKLEELVSACTWIKVAQLGKMIQVFRRAGVKQAAFAGGISRIKLFTGFQPDLRGLALIARVGGGRDDRLLRGATEELEKSGIEVISASVLLKESVASLGVLTKRGLSEDEKADAEIGWEAAKGIGALEIGQMVVVKKGTVVAVEAVEGTDATIKRAGEISGAGGVVVKVAKPQQDLRFDLPTVGVQTMQTMNDAGAKVLVLEHRKALILDPQEVVRLADKLQISIVVIQGPSDL